MNLTRFNQAPAYHPPHHEGMKCLRLQGHEAGTVQAQPALWLGLSILAPGGHTRRSMPQHLKSTTWCCKAP